MAELPIVSTSHRLLRCQIVQYYLIFLNKKLENRLSEFQVKFFVKIFFLQFLSQFEFLWIFL